MALIKRLDIGRPITAAEMDANLQYLEDSISAGTSGTSGVSGSPGVSGTSGSSGVSGTSGSSGVSGSPGVSGTSGSSGVSGTSGSSGVSGSSGSSGVSGVGSAGSNGTSGTSLALSIFDGDLTRLNGITKITLSGLGLNPSGSNGATLTNFGGGGGGSTINVSSGSTTISSVSTVRVDANTMSLTNNGAGTVTIGVLPTTGSLSGNGLVSSSQQITNFGFISSSLTIRKDLSVVSGIQSITLTGSIFLDSSGSNGAFLRVDAGGAPIIVNGFVSSSQQIEDYDVFAVKSEPNRFVGNQEITGSLISTATITATDLFVANAPNFAIPEGSIMVGGSGSRSNFISTASLGISGGSAGISVIDQGLNITFTEKTKLAFTDDFTISASGSDGVVISSVGGGGGSGDGFPYTGSAGISGSLTITNDLSVGGFLTASAFAISSVGTPEIESATNINLTAGNAVVITTSSFRLATFTDAQTGSITAQNGDMIYNSTAHKFMGYASGSWVQLH
jgi:hypothetical protein